MISINIKFYYGWLVKVYFDGIVDWFLYCLFNYVEEINIVE